MGKVAILVMWPGRFDYMFISANQEGYKWNMVSGGSGAFEMFEVVTLWWVRGQKSNNDLDLFYS